MLLCMPWWIYEENFPLVFCPGSLSVAGTCSPNVGPCSAAFQHNLSCLQISVVNTSLCSSSQTVQADALHSRLSHLFSQIYNTEGNSVRTRDISVSGWPAKASQWCLPAHAGSQTEQALPFFSSCSGDLNLVSSPFRQIWISFVIPFL